MLLSFLLHIPYRGMKIKLRFFCQEANKKLKYIKKLVNNQIYYSRELKEGILLILPKNV